MLAWLRDLTSRERRTMLACWGGWTLDGFDQQLYSYVVPTVMCGWPPGSQEFFTRVPVAASCSHVCGLLLRHDMAAGPDGNRGSRPDHCGGVAVPR